MAKVQFSLRHKTSIENLSGNANTNHNPNIEYVIHLLHQHIFSIRETISHFYLTNYFHLNSNKTYKKEIFIV